MSKRVLKEELRLPSGMEEGAALKAVDDLLIDLNTEVPNPEKPLLFTPSNFDFTEGQREIEEDLEKYRGSTFRYHWRGEKAATSSSFWYDFENDFVYTAAHVLEGMDGNIPGNLREGWELDTSRPKNLDIARFKRLGHKSKKVGYEVPVKNMECCVFGYPAGSTQIPEVRKGYVYIRRDSNSWILTLDDYEDPVTSGMSGGIVVGRKHGVWYPLGVIITRNSPAQLDSDDFREDSLDFVAFSDAEF